MREPNIINIGSLLAKSKLYKKEEFILSTGIKKFDAKELPFNTNEYPKGLLKIFRENDLRLTQQHLNGYKENPNIYNIAFSLKYTSLTCSDVYNALTSKNGFSDTDTCCWDCYKDAISTLVNEFNYNAKSFFMYLDYLKTYEAIDGIGNIVSEISNYVNMMRKISPKFEKYPKNFLTTHKIACRNYNRLKEKFDEDKFSENRDKNLEFSYKDYVFIYPKTTQEIKDEAVQQNNCVASYISNVINGSCHIMFLRKKDTPNESLVTLEIRNNKIVQAKRKFNYPTTSEDEIAISKWNEHFGKKEEIA